MQNFYKKYADKDGGLPPGLAKKVKNGKPLPAGWKNKVKPGWQIDDEWMGRMHPLSSAAMLKPNVTPVHDTVGQGQG